jgi:Protein of unknown function (DUF1579)
MEAGKPPQTWRGSESVRSLGDVWVLCEGRCEMPDEGMGTTLMTLGYDPEKKRCVGTFIGSMMTYLWVYDGSLDLAENALTLYAEGPSFAAEGTLAKYKDVIEVKSHDHRILTSHIQGDQGEWRAFMTATYRRKK